MQLQSVRATPKQGVYLKRKLQATCDSKKTPCTTFPLFVRHLYCYVLCASFSVTPPCSQRFCGGGIALLQYLAQITLKSRAHKRTECDAKPSSSLPGVRARVRVHHQFSPGFNVVIRRAAFSGTCPYVFAPKSPLRLAREKDTPFGISSNILLIPSSRRILSSIDSSLRTVSACSCLMGSLLFQIIGHNPQQSKAGVLTPFRQSLPLQHVLS